MHYTIDFDNREGYLFAHVRGKDSVATSLGYWARVREACEQYGQHKVLLIEELYDPPSGADVYQVATTIPTLFLDYTVKIAYVVPDEVTDAHDFGAEISRKRGLDVKQFSRLDKAQDWLLAD